MCSTWQAHTIYMGTVNPHWEEIHNNEGWETSTQSSFGWLPTNVRVVRLDIAALWCAFRNAIPDIGFKNLHKKLQANAPKNCSSQFLAKPWKLLGCNIRFQFDRFFCFLVCGAAQLWS